jgi:hypothetical protein
MYPLYGEVVTEPPADFEEFLRKRFPDAKMICSAVPEYAGNRAPELADVRGLQARRILEESLSILLKE